MNIDDVIKKVGARNEKGSILLDIVLHPSAKLPEGKTIQKGRKSLRLRHFVGVKYSAKELKRYQNESISKPIALKFYKSLFSGLEFKEKILVSDVCYAALAEAEIGRKNNRDTVMYLSNLEKHVLPFFGHMALVDIEIRDVKKWTLEQGKLNISQSTFNKRHYVLKRIFDHAEEEYKVFNIMKGRKRVSPFFSKRKSKEDAFYTQEEVDLVLNDTCEGCTEIEKSKFDFMNVFFYIGVLTGARTGEISALKFSDIDFEKNTITIERSITKGFMSKPKNGKSRIVPMVKKLKERVLKYQETAISDNLFANPSTLEPYTDSRTIVDHRFKPMLKRLGIEYKHLYNLRHTFATLSARKGVKLMTISEVMGHTSGIGILEAHYLKHGNINQDDVRDELESLTA